MTFSRSLKSLFLYPDGVQVPAPRAVLGGLWGSRGRRCGVCRMLLGGELWSLRLYTYFLIWMGNRGSSGVETGATNHHTDLCEVSSPREVTALQLCPLRKSGMGMGGGVSDISSIASGGWTICLPNVLAVSVVEEENATMGDPSGQRGRFCDFTHLKAVFYRWVTAPMLLHPFCTSCSILVKLIGLMYEQNPLVQRLRLMSEFSMISGMSRAETKARFPPLFISLF